MNVSDPSGHRPVDEGGGGTSCNEKLKKSGPKKCPKGTRDRRDLTDWLTRALVDSTKDKRMQYIWLANKNAEKAAERGDRVGVLSNKGIAYWKFKNLVGNDKYYDVKWNIQREIGDKIILGNNTYEFSTTGNILYGFYGTEASFTTYELYRGAGWAQENDYNLYLKDPANYPHPDHIPTLGPANAPYYSDTTDDHEAIVVGVELHKIYEKNGKLR